MVSKLLRSPRFKCLIICGKGRQLFKAKKYININLKSSAKISGWKHQIRVHGEETHKCLNTVLYHCQCAPLFRSILLKSKI